MPTSTQLLSNGVWNAYQLLCHNPVVWFWRLIVSMIRRICLICFGRKKWQPSALVAEIVLNQLKHHLKTTNLADISLFLKLSMQQPQNHQCLGLGLGLICDFRWISLDFSGRNSMTFIWGFFIPQLPLWFHFHSHQENVEPFVNALLKLSGPCTECLVAFDTALQRWGAYDTFLELAKQHWHVEAW